MHPINRICKRRCQTVHKTSFFHLERIALRLLTMTCIAAADIHSLRMALIVAVINAFARLAVNRDCLARMIQRALIAVPFSVAEAFTTGITALFRLTSANHNIPFAAIAIGIIAAIYRRTF